MLLKRHGNLRVCYFGTYSTGEGYPRNRIIIEGLRRNGVEVVECHEDLWKGTSEKLAGIQDAFSIVKKLFKLLPVYLRLVRKFAKIGDYDVIIVGYAGHIDVFLAKVLNLFRGRPLIFDVFISLYDTAVIDRGILSPRSMRARLLHLIDEWACRIADVVLVDTQAHIDYFVREFGLPAGKFHAIPVGSILPVYRPSVRLRDEDDPFHVLYFGSYIPLHGVDVILKAARIIQDRGDEAIVFTLLGTGQLLLEMKGLASSLGLRNVNFVDRFIGEGELSNFIRDADICLGIFGKSDKAMRVIPCKVYNCLAAGKPLITAETPATDGILSHGENVYFCRPGDPESLAMAILELKSNDSLRNSIARKGLMFFDEHFSIDGIGRKVAEIIAGIVD